MRFDVDLVRSWALFKVCGRHRYQRLWFPLLLFSHSVMSNYWQPHGLPGFPVLHHLPEFAQTHVHWVSVAIQPSHPLSSPSPPAFFSASVFPSIRVFSNKLALSIRWPKYWSFHKDYSLLDSSVHGILQARILEWVAISSSRVSSQPKDQIHISYVSYIGRRVLYHLATW